MGSTMQKIRDVIRESIATKERLLQDERLLNLVAIVAQEMGNAFKADKKVLLCGNGGSAADAQHISAELSGRFYTDRDPLFAEALHVNTSYITATANDYHYEEIYARLVKAKGRKGDILIGISTSGNSKNVVKALELANTVGMITVGLTGSTGGKMKEVCRYLLNIPSDDTPRIQESHIMVGHILCELVEAELFGQ